MRLATMLGEVSKSLFKRPVTQKYPFEKQLTPPRLRGQVMYNPEKCTGCGLCAKDCPSDALEVITLDKKAKQFVVKYHVDRCLFCQQCVESCRFGCLSMDSNMWELAALTAAGYTHYFGNETDVQTVLAQQSEADVAPTPLEATA
jgi:formate hydrogenlyase subunit 6/NADH:ubiquinone oxidoreductase subunit I